jgi:clan AA aspartic protease
MITGEVTARREAVVSIRLRGVDGTELNVEAVLDTGFDDYLTLPAPLIAALGLPQLESVPITLGDGQVVRVAVHEARVRWNDAGRGIYVQETGGDILLGMNLLLGILVTLEVMDGGTVTIEALE